MFLRLAVIASALCVVAYDALVLFPVSAVEPSRAISGPGTPPKLAGKLHGPAMRGKPRSKRSPGVRPGKILPVPLDLTDQRRWVVRS